MAVFAGLATIAMAVASPTRAVDGRLSVEIQEAVPGGGVVRSVDLYSRSYALVIGNDSYAGTGWPRLSNAIRDGKAVAEALKAQGFEVSIRSDTSRAELVAALEDFVYGPGADPAQRPLAAPVRRIHARDQVQPHARGVRRLLAPSRRTALIPTPRQAGRGPAASIRS